MNKFPKKKSFTQWLENQLGSTQPRKTMHHEPQIDNIFEFQIKLHQKSACKQICMGLYKSLQKEALGTIKINKQAII